MVAYFVILILILVWHMFWIHIFHFLYVTNIKSSFQKSTMNPFFYKKNSSIILKKIFTKVYYNMDNEKNENFNVWCDFTF
jgi:uncharacterized protein YrrD